ncbi:MAG: hypothetical protein HY815_04990 [Candidatus Riflebacteria bacterium]|nr:hypothetical protein [Candidatus Riflebacteria bacterium]
MRNTTPTLLIAALVAGSFIVPAGAQERSPASASGPQAGPVDPDRSRTRVLQDSRLNILEAFDRVRERSRSSRWNQALWLQSPMDGAGVRRTDGSVPVDTCVSPRTPPGVGARRWTRWEPAWKRLW